MVARDDVPAADRLLPTWLRWTLVVVCMAAAAAVTLLTAAGCLGLLDRRDPALERRGGREMSAVPVPATWRLTDRSPAQFEVGDHELSVWIVEGAYGCRPGVPLCTAAFFSLTHD